MVEDLFISKLCVPTTTPDTVSRTRLVERVGAGFLGKLTVVLAPAGFGKTTSLIDTIRSSDVPSAWVSLDERDNDPLAF